MLLEGLSDRSKQSESSIFLGSSTVSAVLVEVTPLVLSESSSSTVEAPPSLTSFGCKYALQKQTLRCSMQLHHKSMVERKILVEWKSESVRSTTTMSTSTLPLHAGFMTNNPNVPRITFRGEDGENPCEFPIMFLPSEDPSVLDPLPCRVEVYANRNRNNVKHQEVVVTRATLVRVLPPRTAHRSRNHQTVSKAIFSVTKPEWLIRQEFLNRLSGELGNEFLSDELEVEVRRNHNPDTIQELNLRLSMLLSQQVKIGTTADAFRIQRKRASQSLSLERAIQTYCEPRSIPIRKKQDCDQTGQKAIEKRKILKEWDPSLLIHSPNHADGKTLLVQAIAKQVGASLVHIIRPGPLLAKYGIHADAALESILHAVIVSAAAKGKSLCIILDHLDTMMPPRLSGRSSAGDSAAPIFNAIASYLSNVTGSLQRLHEFPFPVKNPLYNPSGIGGRILSVRLCLVGIVTCPDDGWRSSGSDGESNSTILDSMVGGRYRLPQLTASTRFTAFRGAFDEEKLILDASARTRLPLAAASAAWAKGSTFRRVAKELSSIIATERKTSVTVEDLERALATIKKDSSDFAHVSFQAKDQYPLKHEAKKSLFESVGGNTQAKLSLSDALALDPRKRMMLAKFGLSPPTGILLYGPPGCGKTLLAKAVAKMLKDPTKGQTDSLPIGGTFISLSSSDIVQAEIGTSEKMVVSAFQFADKNAPAVIFLDEFQALFTKRSRGGSGKLATTLLQCLDDIKHWRDADEDVQNSRGDEMSMGVARVVVLAATNTPWMVDSAFLRPGRFDRVVHVALPNAIERAAILLVHIARMRVRGRDDATVLQLLCEEIAEKTPGFSGADLAALCRAAAIRSLVDMGEDGWLEDKHFFEALDIDVIASSDMSLVQRLINWRP